MTDGQRRMNDFTKRLQNKSGKNRVAILYITAIALLIISVFVGIMLGSARIRLADIFGA